MTRYVGQIVTTFYKEVVIETDLTDMNDIKNEFLERSGSSLDTPEFDTDVHSIVRVAMCDHGANAEVAQMFIENEDGSTEWLCLHNDDPEEDAANIKEFYEKGK
jgi:hypothetical protein